MATRTAGHWVVILGALVCSGLTPDRARAQVTDDVSASANDQAALNDWSSIDLFWQVHDILAEDDEPSAALWDSLFASTGYAALEARERRSGLLRQAFRVAFKPSLHDSIAAARASSPWLDFHLPLIAQAPERRADVERLRDRAALDALLDSARVLAGAWLPAGATDRLPMARVAWAVFGSQRGYPDMILLDPTLFILHPHPIALLGHELHHNYRSGIAHRTRPMGDDLAGWAIVNVEVEGTAGLVDKRPLLHLDSAALARIYHDGVSSAQYFREYPGVYAESPRWLRVADSLLVRLALETDSVARAGIAAALHGDLPDNGRAMGSWMADAIDVVLGRAALLDVVGDSFGFWRTYQRAAIVSDGVYPALSDPAMRMIADLETRYRLPR
jgi:hypothetical protein